MSTSDHVLGPGPSVSLDIESSADIDRAQRLAATHAGGLGEADRERVAMVATKLATHLVGHGNAARFLVRPWAGEGLRGVEFVATDAASSHLDGREAYRRSGADDPDIAAVARVSDFFDVYSTPAAGSVMMARVWSGRPTAAETPQFLVGSMIEAIPGEFACGDGWAVEQQGARIVALVADGLGHGPGAAQASTAALEVFRDHQREPVETIAGFIHRGLTRTRGAAIAVVEVDQLAGRVRFCGIGNIAMRLVTGRGHKRLVSQFGIAGYQNPNIRTLEHPWTEGALLVMHSDGLSTGWDFNAYDGLERHHPQLAAATVMREATRAHDDAVVIAVRGANGADGFDGTTSTAGSDSA
ncbi:MAG: SpoIIE family protein phosphatase [Nocardioides sp.]